MVAIHLDTHCWDFWAAKQPDYFDLGYQNHQGKHQAHHNSSALAGNHRPADRLPGAEEVEVEAEVEVEVEAEVEVEVEVEAEVEVEVEAEVERFQLLHKNSASSPQAIIKLLVLENKLPFSLHISAQNHDVRPIFFFY